MFERSIFRNWNSSRERLLQIAEDIDLNFRFNVSDFINGRSLKNSLPSEVSLILFDAMERDSSVGRERVAPGCQASVLSARIFNYSIYICGFYTKINDISWTHAFAFPPGSIFKIGGILRSNNLPLNPEVFSSKQTVKTNTKLS